MNQFNPKVGIALSAVQEANMMDLLHRMGAVQLAVPEGGGHCQWIDASAAISAICLAGEKAGGRCSFQAKVRLLRLRCLQLRCSWGCDRGGRRKVNMGKARSCGCLCERVR